MDLVRCDTVWDASAKTWSLVTDFIGADRLMLLLTRRRIIPDQCE